ncbi:MAG: hypothetical protein IKU43_11865 [Clostridia bacterium]|nr:hypothetical protein [Clostridia bacterium]
MCEKGTWEKIVTTRRYLHPPKSENLVTLWSEGKITFGDNLKGAEDDFYDTITAGGLWLAYGDDDSQLDFKTAKQNVLDGYIPVHSLGFEADSIGIGLEAFCSTDRVTTCYAKITVKNPTKSAQKGKLSIFLRNGTEKKLIYGAPDIYVTYAPDISVWKNAPSTFKCTGKSTFSDGEFYLSIFGNIPPSWNSERGAVSLEYELSPNEEKEIILSFSKSNPLPFDYEWERNAVISFWENEITKIKNLPKGIKPNSEKITLIKSLTVQMLQCFCYYKNGSTLIARQGGLQRRTWPGEFFKMLDALGALGDFSDYIKPVIAGCFETQQAENGEILPDGIAWASITGCVLHCYAKYTLLGDKCFYEKYKNNAYKAFKWIKHQRSLSRDAGGESGGIFPPRRASDWPHIVQNWAVTDIPTLCGLEFYRDAAELFKDENIEEIREEATAYRSAMQTLFDKATAKYKDSDIFKIPLSPNDDDDLLFNEYRIPRTRVAHFIRYGFADISLIPKVVKWLSDEGFCKNGLYTKMKKHNPNLWYLTEPEESWLVSFMMAGDYERAKETLDAILNLTVSTEYYTVERYMDNDKYFTPWSPNASGNARIINMLFAYYDVIDE